MHFDLRAWKMARKEGVEIRSGYAQAVDCDQNVARRQTRLLRRTVFVDSREHAIRAVANPGAERRFRRRAVGRDIGSERDAKGLEQSIERQIARAVDSPAEQF